jgi:hypothetical protein
MLARLRLDYAVFWFLSYYIASFFTSNIEKAFCELLEHSWVLMSWIEDHAHVGVVLNTGKIAIHSDILVKNDLKKVSRYSSFTVMV